jgi:hypothetical protein
MPRRRNVGRSRAVRVLLALTAVSACLGAVALAASRPQGREGVSGGAGRTGEKKQRGKKRSGEKKPGKNQADKKQRQTQPPRPSFLEVPTVPSIGAEAQFRFHLTPRAQPPRPPGSEGDVDTGGGPSLPRRFQCRLDGSDWRACSSPHRLDGLAPGTHKLAVRALSPGGRPGFIVHFAWEQLEAKPFTVESKAGVLTDLYPGESAQTLPVLVTNPNPVPIHIISLTVAIGNAPSGCPAEPNFALTPASVSSAAPLTVPAGASVGLPSPAASAPAIALRDLSVNQDACQGTSVPLVFNGEAHG